MRKLANSDDFSTQITSSYVFQFSLGPQIVSPMYLPLLFQNTGTPIAFLSSKDNNFDSSCLVPGCDTNDTHYGESWIKYAVPGTTEKDSFKPKQCIRFTRNEQVSQCGPEMFTNHQEVCDKWIFKEGERTIVNDVRLSFCRICQ